MPSYIKVCIGTVALLSPLLHMITDIMEWMQNGFSDIQLWMNYAAFLPMPYLIIGLYAVQLPKIKWYGLLGALLYGLAFIYFSHSTLYAINHNIPTYAVLWTRLGITYSIHGGLMVIGGFTFGIASIQAKVFSRTHILFFIIGIAINTLIAIVSLPEILQITGSLIRNAGLIGFGMMLLSGSYQVTPANHNRPQKISIVEK